MPSTLSQQLLHYLMERNDWIPSPQITDDIKWKNQRTFKYYTSPTVQRELRSLENGELGESKIAVKKWNKSVAYRYIPPDMRKRYIPKSERLTEALFSK